MDFDPGARVGHLLRRAYHIAKANTGAGLRELGITPMQAAAIMALRRDGPLSQAELGRALGMQPANVHGLVARLQKAKLIDVTPDAEDQRQTCIALASEGRRQAARIAAITVASAEATLAPLAPAERDVLLALLRRIARAESS